MENYVRRLGALEISVSFFQVIFGQRQVYFVQLIGLIEPHAGFVNVFELIVCLEQIVDKYLGVKKAEMYDINALSH